MHTLPTGGLYGACSIARLSYFAAVSCALEKLARLKLSASSQQSGSKKNGHCNMLQHAQ